MYYRDPLRNVASGNSPEANAYFAARPNWSGGTWLPTA